MQEKHQLNEGKWGDFIEKLKDRCKAGEISEAELRAFVEFAEIYSEEFTKIVAEELERKAMEYVNRPFRQLPMWKKIYVTLCILFGSFIILFVSLFWVMWFL